MTSNNPFETVAELNKQIQEAGLEWQANVTGISHLSDDQFAQLCGAIDSPSEEIKAYDFGETSVELPEIVNWYNAQGCYVLPVMNQGQCGSCVAFATSQCVATNAQIQNSSPLGNKMYAAKYWLSPAAIYFCAEGFRDCSRGMSFQNALNFLKDRGVPSNYNMPMKAEYLKMGLYPTLCASPTIMNKLTQINGYWTLANIQEQKRWLYEKGSLVGIMTVYPSFRDYGSKTAGYKPLPGEKPLERARHGIHIIGYNDQLNSWICQNSWGADWGVGGYFFLDYGACDVTYMFGISGFISNGLYKP